MPKPVYPPFVRLGGGSCLRRTKDGTRKRKPAEYYRDGGAWYVGVKYKDDGSMVAVGTGYMSHVNGFPVTEVTEQEWRDSNAQYTPSQDVIDKLLAT